MKNTSAPEFDSAPSNPAYPDSPEIMPQRNALVRFVTSTPVRMFVGLSVAASALVEIAHEVEQFSDLWQNIGARHGIFLVGVMQFLQALGELLDGMDETVEARQENRLLN